jgi:hypothetical protein
VNALVHRDHQIGDDRLLQRAQMLKARGLQSKPGQRGKAVIGGGLAGTGHAPELLRFTIGLTVH